MPREPCYWTRKLELKLVDFIKQRPYIWRPAGNTNHTIQRKYKAYAEFASTLGGGFTARSVRDRWVNIRSTYNHNLRRIEKSKEESSSTAEVYVPSWPLWEPLQFLRDTSKYYENEDVPKSSIDFDLSLTDIDNEVTTNTNLTADLPKKILNPPHNKTKFKKHKKKCRVVLNDLITSMAHLSEPLQEQEQSYWFFGRHVTQRLNAMSVINSDCAAKEILKVLEQLSHTDHG